MYGKKILVAALLAACIQGPGAPRPGERLPAQFSGESALAFTQKAVSFGPRPPGSEAIRKLRSYIFAQLKLNGWEAAADSFTAQTPVGPLPMTNIIARLPGVSGRAVVFSGHYDTKSMPGIRFVGANDGGSSAGFLLEMARVLARRPRKHDVYLVWFDGEEAIGSWSATDGVYGSRHLAEKWAADGTLGRIVALINVDMIGDRDLGIVREMNSSPALRSLVWQTAAQLGFGRYFLDHESWIEDDHVPFVKRGVPALDLIDFDYGPDHAWWHTEGDTLDKLSARSFEVVGTVLLEVLRKLES
jgi:Zn-dependent M28 family amino/carboxypeptidase